MLLYAVEKEIVFPRWKILLLKGDITLADTDAVVNAANSSLLGGGGVDGAIHRAGGLEILEECREIRRRFYPDGLPPGEAVSTGAGKMKTRYVIHTVGPVWNGGSRNEDSLLKNCYRNSLHEAEKLSLMSIAFPAISTGVYGFPKERAARIVSGVLSEEAFIPSGLTVVQLYFFSDEDLQIFCENASWNLP